MNKEYQELNKISKPMTSIDLKGLVDKKIFEKLGTTGRGTEYIIISMGERANNGLKGLPKG